MNISRIIIVVSHLPILLSALYTFIYFKKFSKPLQIFSYSIFFSSVIQFISLLLWFYRVNNMPLLHLYVIGQILLLGWFYQKVLGGYINVRIIWFVTILFSIFSIINSFFFQNIFSFNSYAITFQSVLITIVTIFSYIVFLNKIVQQENSNDILSLNWINSGLFIYHASNLLIFYFGASILGKISADLGLQSWILHSFFSIIMYTCFLVGLYKAPK